MEGFRIIYESGKQVDSGEFQLTGHLAMSLNLIRRQHMKKDSATSVIKAAKFHEAISEGSASFRRGIILDPFMGAAPH